MGIDLKNSRALITGGAGLIGSHIADLLIEEGAGEIVVLDNLVRGSRANLSSAMESGRVKLIEGDIRDPNAVGQAMDGVDVVFHQAAIRITQCAEDPRLALEVLVNGTYNVIEAAAKAKVSKVIAASSASVYGLADEFPTNETQHPYHNRTLYGAAKSFSEGLLRSFNEMYALPYAALRYFNVYGPRMDIHGAYTEVLIRWMDNIAAGRPPRILGDGSQTLDLVHVVDIARANILAAKSDCSDEVFNVGTETETSLNDLANTLLKVMGSSLRPEYGPERAVNPVRRRLADVRKARELLGFETHIALEAGLESLVSWWSAERQRRVTCRPEAPHSIPLTKPEIGEPEVRAAARPILSGWVTQGPEVAAFEREFAAYTGARHACAVSSCTAALHLALLAVGVKPGDEVITVSHSFVATANAIVYCGATPVFVDIERRTFNMDPALMEEAITERTRAILCVHQMGLPCDLDAILEIARRHSLPVVEDAACALGSEILRNGAWERIGRPHGDVACFSFHPRKLLTTGDGGMLTTNRPALDERFRLLRQHGMTVPDSVRHSASRVVFEQYAEVGFNYRMTDIQAAVGRRQLDRLEEMVRDRRAVAERYRISLARMPGTEPPAVPSWARTNWQSYCVGLPEGCEQREVMQFMLDRGVSTRRGIMCSHREPAYSKQPWRATRPLAHSEAAQDRCIVLPMYAGLSEASRLWVIETLAAACADSAAARERAPSALAATVLA